MFFLTEYFPFKLSAIPNQKMLKAPYKLLENVHTFKYFLSYNMCFFHRMFSLQTQATFSIKACPKRHKERLLENVHILKVFLCYNVCFNRILSLQTKVPFPIKTCSKHIKNFQKMDTHGKAFFPTICLFFLYIKGSPFKIRRHSQSKHDQSALQIDCWKMYTH